MYIMDEPVDNIGCQIAIVKRAVYKAKNSINIILSTLY